MDYLNLVSQMFKSMTLFGCTLFLLSVTSLASSKCPHNLTRTTHACFANYTIRYESMQRSSNKLCCGVDVETLRSFCRAYIDGVRCVSRLKNQCTARVHQVIDNALVNLDGAWDSLTGLCEDDTLIEKYAMYQSCFTMVGDKSEACFSKHLEGHDRWTGAKSNITFLSTVTVPRFCSKMRATVSCFQSNILNTCGSLAASLSHILFKPMVRYSSQCDYSSTIRGKDQSSKRSHEDEDMYISDGRYTYSEDTGDDNNHIAQQKKDRNRGEHKAQGSSGRNTASIQTIQLPTALTLLSMLLILHYR